MRMSASTARDLPLRCSCKTISGVAHLAGAPHQRLACYCRDCQAFAWFLGRPELLDPHGGTQIVQTRVARLELHEGRERLACMRLSPTGLMRWYASCCRTPIANTLAKPKVAFVGIISAFWDPDVDANALLGPVQARINGPGHADAHGHMADIDKFPLAVILGAIRNLIGGQLRREWQPTPFWQLETGTPSVEPHVLDPAEREVIYGKLG
jgi:hypothetical protein